MHPAFFPTHDPQPTTLARRSAFTLIEMLTTVAVLIILLGLMIDLAGYVRNRSANDLTRQVLAGLDVAMSQYISAHKMMPAVHPFATDANLNEDEDTLLQSALENNRDFVAALKANNLLSGNVFSHLPVSIYDGITLNDAWDTPIVFMPASHPRIGMAPGGKGFFFSAGPDRQYKTREDNLYSYEATNGG
jgi:type II secretory pathway pseudopilin PulG